MVRAGVYLVSVSLGGVGIKDNPVHLHCPWREIGSWPADEHVVGLAIGPAELVYAAFEACICVFTTDGKKVRQWGRKGTGESEFSAIGGLAVGSDGLVFCT